MPLLTTYAAATGRSYGARLAVPLFSIAVEAAATSVNEGSSLTFNISGTDIVSGTYYWQINHITTASADFTATSGSFTITDNVGSFVITTVADFASEGNQTFTASVLGTVSGPVVATSSTITINDTSLFNYTVTPAASSVNEGASLTVNVTTVPADGTFYWTINHITTVDADFSAVNGTVITSSGAGSFTITASDDLTTEGAQTFTISMREGSITGTVLATSTTVTVNDTSLTPAVTISPAVGGVSTFNPYTQPFGSRINFGGTSCGTWTITPNNNITADLKIWGAGGGGTNHAPPSGIVSYGGGGGYTGVQVVLLKNTAYHFIVGCGGGASVGPGSDDKGAGGGAGSAIRVVSGSIVIAVAGGGGGGGFSNSGGAQGGAGGGYSAEPGGLGGTTAGQGPQLAAPYYPAGGGETDGTAGIGGRNRNGQGSPGSGADGGAGYPGNGGGAAGGGGYGTGGSGGLYTTNAGGGGGGAGYRGGGGGGGDIGGDGGGGGSGYWDGFRTISGYSETGSGRTPGNSGDSDRGTAGLGGSQSAGNPGKIVWGF
jgi:hypothetical protein